MPNRAASRRRSTATAGRTSAPRTRAGSRRAGGHAAARAAGGARSGSAARSTQAASAVTAPAAAPAAARHQVRSTPAAAEAPAAARTGPSCAYAMCILPTTPSLPPERSQRRAGPVLRSSAFPRCGRTPRAVGESLSDNGSVFCSVHRVRSLGELQPARARHLDRRSETAVTRTAAPRPASDAGGLLAGVIAWASGVRETLGGPAAGLAFALETLFPPIPSEVILPLAGFTASQGDL